MSNKVCIITGASSGIGRALAFEMASHQYNVVLAARSNDLLIQIEEEIISKHEVKVLVCATDVSVEEDCKNLISTTVKAFSRIDILINNAGVSMRALFANVDLSVIKRLMDVNFWGTVYCTKYALPYITEMGGSIVGVTSLAGFHGLPGRCGYSASKFAMHGFLETIRIENLKSGVHVLIAAPSFTTSNVRKSALTANGSPQGFSPRDEHNMMTSDEVARKIWRGIKHRKRNIIFSLKGKLGVLLQRIFPGTLDRIFYKAMAKEPDSPIK